MIEQISLKQKRQRVFNILNKTEEVVLVAMIATTVVLVFIQIIMRYVFNNSLTWTEELARYLFIWYSWLGISIGAQKQKHITIDVVVDRFKGKASFVILTIADLCSLAILIALTYYGIILTIDIISFHTVSTVLRIPMWIIYVSLPVSCGLMSIRLVSSIWTRFMRKEAH